MPNAYLTADQLVKRADFRTVLQLSGDQNARQGDLDNIQELLDQSADDFDQEVNGQYDISPAGDLKTHVLPKVRWYITTRTIYALWGRRQVDIPPFVLDQMTRADAWIEKVKRGETILGAGPMTAPSLSASDFFNGRSRFDFTNGHPAPWQRHQGPNVAPGNP